MINVLITFMGFIVLTLIFSNFSTLEVCTYVPRVQRNQSDNVSNFFPKMKKIYIVILHFELYNILYYINTRRRHLMWPMNRHHIFISNRMHVSVASFIQCSISLYNMLNECVYIFFLRNI